MMAENQELENTPIVLLNSIEKRILTIRGLKVMLDADLAELDKKVAVHDVSIKNLVETIRRLANPSEKKRRRVGFDCDLSLDNKE